MVQEAADSTIKLDLTGVREQLARTDKFAVKPKFEDPLVIINSGQPNEPRFSVSALLELLEQGTRMTDAEREQHVGLFTHHARELTDQARAAADPNATGELLRQAFECAAIGRLFQCIVIGRFQRPSE